MKKDQNKKEEKNHPEGTLGEVKINKAGEETTFQEEEKNKEEAAKKEGLTAEEKLEEKTREAAEYFDKWLRLRAELENFKKRMQKEKAELLKFGNESLLQAILPVLDNLARAIAHGKNAKENTSILEGVELTQKQFLSILERFGVQPIEAVGKIFDPEKHEAVAQEENGQEPNQVIAEVEKGYLFHDRLLRPAKVVVAKAKTDKREGT